MKVSRRYLITLAIQAVGPLSMLMLSFTIVNIQGAAAQGGFATARAWLDLIVVVGLFGLPQSIVLAVNRADASRRILFGWAVRYALGCLAATAAAVWVASRAGADVASLAIVFAAATWVLMGIWRSILLTVDDGLRFNLVTVVPTLAVAALAGGVLLAAQPIDANLDVIFAGAGVVALAICLPIARRPVFALAQAGRSPDYRLLFAHGFDVFVLNVCNSLQVYLCYQILGRVGSPDDVGYISIALLVLNAFNFPLQSISPMLLNHWSKSSSVDALSAGSHQVRMIGALLTVLSAISVVVAIAAMPLLFRAGDSPPAEMWLILFSVVPALLARTSAVRLASIGEFRFNSRVAALQTIAFAVGFLSLAKVEPLHPIGAAVVAWLVADVAAAGVFFFKLRAVMRAHIKRD